MKKTAAILAAIAALSLCGTSAFAANGNNIVDGVLNGAEDVVDGVISGAEDIVTPGGSTGAVQENNNNHNNASRPATESAVTPGTSANNAGNAGNVNTGVPVGELAALGAAAVGGLATMAVTVRKRK